MRSIRVAAVVGQQLACIDMGEPNFDAGGWAVGRGSTFE
jgi:hypothetical protein